MFPEKEIKLTGLSLTGLICLVITVAFLLHIISTFPTYWRSAGKMQEVAEQVVKMKQCIREPTYLDKNVRCQEAAITVSTFQLFLAIQLRTEAFKDWFSNQFLPETIWKYTAALNFHYILVAFSALLLFLTVFVIYTRGERASDRLYHPKKCIPKPA
jgi:hypothetical protein